MMSGTPLHLIRRAARAGIATSAIAVGSIVALALPAAAAQAPVGLGTASSFAVLAGSGVTNTGPTTITGDLGTFPTLTETGIASVTLIGTNHAGDAVTQGAKDSLVTAYDDAAGRTPVTNVPVELGGSTLAPGVYSSGTFGITGTLTLDAAGDPNAQFIFQAASTLIAEANSHVVLVNGASPCQVVWKVGSSATFKAGSTFVGNVLALTSITAQTGATFQGRLLARNGAVTLDTNTITNAMCTTGGTDAGASTSAGDASGSDANRDGAVVGDTAPDRTVDDAANGGPGGPADDTTTTARLAFTGTGTTGRGALAFVLIMVGALVLAGARYRRIVSES
jgi:hypothetical protein